jgi:neutral ceramidase
MSRFASLFLAVFALLATSDAARSADKKPFRAGVATSNITPWLGDGLVGDFGTPPPAKHVHDELHARCFVLDDGNARIAIVINDNIYISREVLDEANRQISEYW